MLLTAMKQGLARRPMLLNTCYLKSTIDECPSLIPCHESHDYPLLSLERSEKLVSWVVGHLYIMSTALQNRHVPYLTYLKTSQLSLDCFRHNFHLPALDVKDTEALRATDCRRRF